MGALRIRYPQGAQELINTNLIVNLTDDIHGKDLTEFRKVFDKCKLSKEFLFPGDDEFVHIMTSKLGDDSYVPHTFLNFKEIPTENSTMPLFTFISKLTKNLSNISDKDYVVTPSFKYGFGGENYLLPNLGLSSIKGTNVDVKDMVYCPETVRAHAKDINNDIFEQMLDYLC